MGESTSPAAGHCGGNCQRSYFDPFLIPRPVHDHRIDPRVGYLRQSSNPRVYAAIAPIIPTPRPVQPPVESCILLSLLPAYRAQLMLGSSTGKGAIRCNPQGCEPFTMDDTTNNRILDLTGSSLKERLSFNSDETDVVIPGTTANFRFLRFRG
jgi:hypothetical protein